MNRLHELLPQDDLSRVALIDHDESEWTYEDLHRESDALAEIYKAEGLRPGDRLIVLAENSRYYALAILACSKLDVWVTLLNARQTAEEVEALTEHSGARMLTFTHDASPDASAHAKRLEAREVGEVAGQRVLMTAPRDVEPEPVRAGSDQIAALMYTTGTTSAPKGVMLSHDNLFSCATRVAHVNEIIDEDQMLMVLPGTHIFALGSVMLPVFERGGKLRFLNRFDPAEIIDLLRGGITIFPGVPQMHAGLIAFLAATGQEVGPHSLRYLASGGAPLDPALAAKAKQVFGVPILNGWGLTETSPTLTMSRLDNPPTDMAVGQAIPDVEIRVREPNEHGIGELEVRGPVVMQGYYKAPDKTAEVLSEDRWFRTGDLGHVSDDGFVYIEGRLKELIIRSGFNVYPPEIEAMLTKHPQIHQASVVGRTVPGNEEICAFVMADPGLDPDEVKAWLHEHLTPYKIPQHIVAVEGFPSAATGKILKHKLLDHFADRLPQTVA